MSRRRSAARPAAASAAAIAASHSGAAVKPPPGSCGECANGERSITDWLSSTTGPSSASARHSASAAQAASVARGSSPKIASANPGQHPRRRHLRQRGAEQPRELARVAGLGGVGGPGEQPGDEHQHRVPPSATSVCPSAQRVRETAVASSGSARPSLSSPRRRSTEPTANAAAISAIIPNVAAR